MTKPHSFTKIFSGTTIDGDQVLTSLSKCPAYTNEILAQAALHDHAAYCERLFREYLIRPTEYINVRKEVGYFLEFEPEEAPPLILQALDSLKQLLLDNEWYELMPRFENFRRRLHQQFNL